MVTIAILAGGASARMGSDKAALVLGGETLLARLNRVARTTGCPVVVVGRPAPDGWSDPATRFFVDEEPGLGPLGGLATALRRLKTPVLALACDLPRVDTELLDWLLKAWSSRGGDGLAAARGGEPEPLLAVYSPDLLPVIERRLAEGRRSLKGVLAEVGAATLEVPAAWAERLDGVNTPEEWARLA